MPYTFKDHKPCEKSDGTKGKFYTKKKGKPGRCYDSETAYKKSMQAGYAGDSADELEETMLEIKRGIRKIILEVCSCETELPEPGVAYPIEIEEIIVDPVMDLITQSADSYPDKHVDDNGRMFDYGHTKSDSHEGRMTRAKLYRMGKMAQSFHDRLEDGDDLPQWVNDKVTTAEDRLRSAFEYMDYKLHRNKLQGKMCNESTIRSMARNYLRSVL